MFSCMLQANVSVCVYVKELYVYMLKESMAEPLTLCWIVWYCDAICVIMVNLDC